jgi:hypothetical protein
MTPIDQDGVRAGVEAALRALPVPKDCPPPPAERELIISHCAQRYLDLLLESSRQRLPLAKKEVETQLLQVGRKATELFEFLERTDPLVSEALNRAMKEMGFRPAKRRPFSSAAIDPPPKSIGDIKGRLEVLIDAADTASVPATAKGLCGPVRKLHALETAKAAAEDYQFLTRETPSRSKNKGGFLDFLSSIFKALGIEGVSVDNVSKQALTVAVEEIGQ